MSRNVISDEEALLRELQRELYAQYDRGKYAEALRIAEEVYTIDAVRRTRTSSMLIELLQARTDNLLLLGAINFQLRNFSEAIFYNQQVRSRGHFDIYSRRMLGNPYRTTDGRGVLESSECSKRTR